MQDPLSVIFKGTHVLSLIDKSNVFIVSVWGGFLNGEGDACVGRKYSWCGCAGGKKKIGTILSFLGYSWIYKYNQTAPRTSLVEGDILYIQITGFERKWCWDSSLQRRKKEEKKRHAALLLFVDKINSCAG